MRSLTRQEQEVMELTGDLANAFVALPVLHAADVPEFVALLHGIQNMIYARPAFEEFVSGDGE